MDVISKTSTVLINLPEQNKKQNYTNGNEYKEKEFWSQPFFQNTLIKR